MTDRQLSAIPIDLKAFQNWVVWKEEIRDGKTTKVPYNAATGERAQTDHPETWTGFSEALKALPTADGLGFVWSEADPYVGIDLDGCRDPETGAITAWAKRWVDQFYSYTELSPSGTGLHIIVRGEWPRDWHVKAIPGVAANGKRPQIEVYDRVKYYTITGLNLPGMPLVIANGETALDALHREFTTPTPEPGPRRQSQPVDLDDAELLDVARNAVNGDKFRRLYDHGDMSAHGEDPSAASLALCNHLAFYFGCDEARMDRVFRSSALMREKWDSPRPGGTWGQLTMREAIRTCREPYRTSRGRDTGNGKMPHAEQDQEPELQPLEEGLGLNDKGNSWRLVTQFGRDLRFCKNLGWLIWDGHRWEPDERQQISEYAKAVVSSLYREAAGIQNEDHRKLMASWAVRSGMKERILAMAKLAESDPAIVVRAEALDANPWLLNVANGTLDLRTGVMREASRQDMITRQIPVSYDPDAKCLEFKQFLLQVMDTRSELVAYLQRWVGYCLTGDTREQSLLFLYGAGANGKSTFLGVLQQLLGDYAKQAAPGLLLSHAHDRHPTEIADLRGARLVVSVEVGEGKKLAEDLVKQMTGGDKMKGRFMHRDFIEFFPEFKLFLAANHKPVIQGTDYAIWRRIPLVPFDVTFTDKGPNFKDVKLAEKLRAELPGILAWGVRGCQEWLERGLAAPEVVVDASKAYRTEMDVFGDFLADECIEHRNCSVSAGSLYEAYKQWAGMTGERAMSQKMLANKLKEKGFRSDRESGERLRIWKGLQLRSLSQPDPRMGEDG